MAENSTVAATPLQHQCLTCSKIFKSYSHLRRHELSHAKEPSHQCPSCSRRFARHDALRRHFKTCSHVKETDAIPTPAPVSKRGRKQCACYNCRSKKLKCDGAQPCTRCSSRGLDCSYSPEDGENGTKSRVPIRFLLNFTNPILEAVSDAYPLSEAHAEPCLGLRGSFCNPGSYTHDGFMADLFSGDFLELYTYQDDMPGGSALASLPRSGSVQNQVEALLQLLQAQYDSTFKPFKFPTSQFPMDLARVVFTSDNVLEYVSAFFSSFHPHTPFLHRPSFDIATASVHLLLAVVLLGSIFCTPQDDALSARYFFSLGEEYVFGLLRDKITRGSDASCENLEVVQAAVLFHALQVNSNNEDVRHRIRVHRFPDIVAAIRCLGLFSTTRTSHAGFGEWERFVLDEVKIRLATTVFVTDCMWSLWFKSPPFITAAEMSGDLQSTNALFETTSSAEFALLTATSPSFDAPVRTLKDLIALFMREDWDGPESTTLAPIGSEHLLILMFAFHSVIFVSRTGLLMPSTYPVLFRATNRWKELWHHVYSKNVLDNKNLIGFTRYGLELWWLAQKILDLSNIGDLSSPYMASGPTTSLEQLHGFIRKYVENDKPD